jgi:dihydropteroate synthase
VSAAPEHELHARDRRVRLGARPLLMGIVNATPDSFSDAGTLRTLDERVARAEELVAAGAELIDVGGETGITGLPPVPAEEEIERVVPLIERIASLDVLVSVDTYKPPVARAAVEAGAAMVNDTSGLRDPAIADVCAQSGAALVLMHTAAPPKLKVLDHPYDDVAADVAAFLRARIELATGRGVGLEQIVLDPGPDFGKSPGQTVAVLRGLRELHELGRPLLLAVSRKDFVGALTGRRPRARLAGTLAAIAEGVDAGAHILRVHDVREAADFLAVRAALRGEADIPDDLRLPDDLRREPLPG